MTDEQKYCVAAFDRLQKRRRDISGPLSRGQAIERQQAYLKSYRDKKYYKYFHVAKYPYKRYPKNPK